MSLSKDNTTVLTVVDSFSKMVHFVALPKLPLAKEMAGVMMWDLGFPGFPRRWETLGSSEFGNQLGAKVSLSTMFHPHHRAV